MTNNIIILAMPLFAPVVKLRKHSATSPTCLPPSTPLATCSTTNLSAAELNNNNTSFYHQSVPSGADASCPPPSSSNPEYQHQPYSAPSAPVQSTPPVYAYNQQVSQPSAASDEPKRHRPWQSCVHLPGSLSQTLHDAGDLAYEVHDQMIGSTNLEGLRCRLAETRQCHHGER
ncbi:hypothetical protein VTN96DRAFT_6781 [Rasamsonia emersonii]